MKLSAQRILVLGSSGAGKSTLSAKLGPLLNLPVIHLDYEFWNPGWVQTALPEWRENVKTFVAKPRWVIDGNFDKSLDIRLPRCDMVIYLDFPTRICLYRIIKRVFIYKKGVRPDMAKGCHERFDFEFIWWVFNFRRNIRPKVMDMLKKHDNGNRVLFFKTQKEVDKYLAKLEGN